MEELLNFILLACGAPCTDGPYQPPEVREGGRREEGGIDTTLNVYYYPQAHLLHARPPTSYSTDATSSY